MWLKPSSCPPAQDVSRRVKTCLAARLRRNRAA